MQLDIHIYKADYNERLKFEKKNNKIKEEI